ncbi:MAG: hypothetical protein KAX49_01585 [Halanaerobiales bacterium]|nr:hypothetical protein [Halanaerobiales bacterium]
MKKSLMVVLVVVLVGLVVVPTFAFGGFGFGSRGMMGNLSEEDFPKWVQDQVDDGWITQKQADYMIEMHDRRINGVTEEDYTAWVDQQLQDGWITESQAEYMKENFKVMQERFGEDTPFMMGRGGFGCSYANGEDFQQQPFGMRRGGMKGGRRGW